MIRRKEDKYRSIAWCRHCPYKWPFITGIKICPVCGNELEGMTGTKRGA